MIGQRLSVGSVSVGAVSDVADTVTDGLRTISKEHTSVTEYIDSVSDTADQTDHGERFYDYSDFYDIEYSATANTINSITDFVGEYIIPAIAIIGLVGNSLTLFVAGNWKKNYPFLLRVLAVTDSCNLVVMAVDNAILVYKDEMMYSMNEWGCRLGLFVVTLLQYYESWVVVLITVERYISIIHPVQAKFIFDKSRIKAILVGMLIFVLIDTLPHVISFGVVESTYVFECGPIDQFGRWYINKYSPIARVIFYIILPFAILLFCNIAIITQLIAVNRTKELLNTTNTRKVKLNKVGPLLLSINFIFLTSQAPLLIYLRTERGNTMWSPDPVSQAYLDLELTLLFSLAYINYAVNFYIYVMSNNDMRQRCKKLLLCRNMNDEFKPQPTKRSDLTSCKPIQQPERQRQHSFDDGNPKEEIEGVATIEVENGRGSDN